MGFWSWIKSIPGKIADGAKTVASKVWDTSKNIVGKLNTGMDIIKEGAGKISNMPVIGDVVRQFASSNPTASRVIDTFNRIDSGLKTANNLLNPMVEPGS